MKNFFCILLCISCSLTAKAEEAMNHAQHMTVFNNDSRQLLNYPPDVRTQALANMRSHLEALSEIMEAFANAKYTEAADIADRRLGMSSQGAAGCRQDSIKTGIKMTLMSESDHLNHQMSLLMPEKMRELGQNMHKSANDFAVKARDAEKDNQNVALAAIALARIPRQCVACHEVYRMQ